MMSEPHLFEFPVHQRLARRFPEFDGRLLLVPIADRDRVPEGGDDQVQRAGVEDFLVAL